MKLAFFASHGGSNMQAILDACQNGELKAKPVIVICNNSRANALNRAEKAGVRSYIINSLSHPDDEERDQAMLALLEQYEVDLVILAGYMKKIGSAVLSAYKGRILNIHPALLPKYGGRGMYGHFVHEAVLAAGEKESGVTVHVIDEIYDNGPVLNQRKVPVLPHDTPDTLAARVLKEEHLIYKDTIAGILNGTISLP